MALIEVLGVWFLGCRSSIYPTISEREVAIQDKLEEGTIHYTNPSYEWIAQISDVFPIHKYENSPGVLVDAKRIPGGNDCIEAAEYDLGPELRLSISRSKSHNDTMPFHVSISNNSYSPGESAKWTDKLVRQIRINNEDKTLFLIGQKGSYTIDAIGVHI